MQQRLMSFRNAYPEIPDWKHGYILKHLILLKGKWEGGVEDRRLEEREEGIFVKM